MTLRDNPSWVALTRGTLEARSRTFAGHRTEAVSRDQVAQLLAAEVQRSVVAGARVDYATDAMAVIVYGKRPNHVLHLLLTVLSFGLWAAVWFAVAVVGRPWRIVLTVDECGNVARTSAR